MDFLSKLASALPDTPILTGPDCAPWVTDWTGAWHGEPMAVIRPASTAEVSQIMAMAHAGNVPVVPAGGRTGLVGGAHAPDALVVSLDRMNTIRQVTPRTRTAIVEAGVILQSLRESAADVGMQFPMTFGAQGSATIGGILSTNAGGSNVLKYGNTRDLCLGIEAVLPDGTVLDLMSELHKDNTGYALKHLLIGAEGTLGIITAAVLKLSPAPRVRSTAFLACPSLTDALTTLNRLQEATSDAVEAFEYMPAHYMAAYADMHPQARQPFADIHGVNILVELASTAPRDTALLPEGTTVLQDTFESTLATLFEEGLLTDATIATNDSQRAAFWAIRESAAELSLAGPRAAIVNDIALPLDEIASFLDRMNALLPTLDADAFDMTVAHLGDGNIHYTVRPSDKALKDTIMSAVEAEVRALGGSFSAEHGVGQSKLSSMTRHKNAAALDTMRAIKQAIDPTGILNPGKVIPPASSSL